MARYSGATMGTLEITGGRVLVADGSIDRADIAIDNDRGVIDAIEPPGGLAVQPDEELDAGEAVVIPGLVNAHSHVAMTLLRGYADDKPLHAWLEEDIFPIEAKLRPEDVRVGARLGMLEMIKSGTTAFCDMYFHEEAIADVAEEAGMRALLGYGIIALGKDEDGIEAELEATRSFVAYCHERTSERVQPAVMPHAIRTVDTATLHRVSSLAAELDVPIHLHMSETAGDVQAVIDRDGGRPVEIAEACDLLGSDRFLAHGVHLEDDEIATLASTGTGVAHCPSANLKLASGIAPVARLLEAGVPVGIGTDGPASNNDLDMFEELRLAALLAKVAADDATAVPAETAMRCATEGGAGLLKTSTGRLEVGAPADLAVVDVGAPHFTPPHDLLSHLVYTAKGGDVRHTVCNGEVLMRDRRVLPLDEAAVREAATEHAFDLVDRAV